MVKTKEVLQLTRAFVDAPKAVEIQQHPAVPPRKWFRQLPAPGETTYGSQELTAVESAGKGLSLKDYFTLKENASKAFALMTFGECMSFCQLGQELCTRSSKEVAAANAAFFSELSAIAVDVYNRWHRHGMLGREEIRFKTRVHMQLMGGVCFGVLHVGTTALDAFDNVTDDYGALKIPRYGALTAISSRAERCTYSSQAGSQLRKASCPTSGCWLCPSPDHFAYDKEHHPRLPDGSRPSVSEQDKKAILQRIRNSSFQAADKEKEEAAVKAYWAQHKL